MSATMPDARLDVSQNEAQVTDLRDGGERIRELCRLNEFERSRERYETQKANRARYFQKKANKQG